MKIFANQRPLLTLPPLGDIEVWAQSTLKTHPFSPEQSRKRRWVTKHSRCSLQVSQWRNASNYPYQTVGSWFRISWLVSRCNVCSFWSFVDWFVATHRRSITLLYKHRIHSLKIFYPGPSETLKSFGRWTHKISLLSKCYNHFPTKAKVFPSVLPKIVCLVSLRIRNKSAQRKRAKYEKTSRGKISKRGSTVISKTYNLEAKKRHVGVRKGHTAH